MRASARSSVSELKQQLLQRLADRFQAYADLGQMLDQSNLTEKVDVAAHKSLAEHLWCLVGARESYAAALNAGQWQGFACSMQSFDSEDFQNKLETSAAQLQAAVAAVDPWTAAHNELLLKVYEHEVMHEGQIIRHVYAMGGRLPASWVWA